MKNANVFGLAFVTGLFRQSRRRRDARRFVTLRGGCGFQELDARVLLSGGSEIVTSATGGVTTVGSLPWAVANATEGTEISFASGITTCTVTTDMVIPAENVSIFGMSAGPNGQDEVINASSTNGPVFTVGTIAQGAFFQGLEIENSVNSPGSAAIVFNGTTYGSIYNGVFDDNIGGSVIIAGADDDLTMLQNTFTQDTQCSNGDVFDDDSAGGNLNMTGIQVTGDTGTSPTGASFFGADLTDVAEVVIQEGTITGCSNGYAVRVNMASTDFASTLGANLIDFSADDGALLETSSPGAINASRVVFAGDSVSGSTNSLGAVYVAATGTTIVGEDYIYGSPYTGVVVNANGVPQVTATIVQDAIENNGASNLYGGGILVDTNSDTQVQVIDSTIANNQALYGGGIDWSPLSGGQSGNLYLVSDTIAYNAAYTTGGGVDTNGGVVYSDNTIYANNTMHSKAGAPDVAGSVMSHYDLYDSTAGATITGNHIVGSADFAPAAVLNGAPGDPYFAVGYSLPLYSYSPAIAGGDSSLDSAGAPFDVDMNNVPRQGAVIGAVVTFISAKKPVAPASGSAADSAVDAVLLGTLGDLFPVGSNHKSTMVD